MSSRPCLPGVAFDPETMLTLDKAFDHVCDALREYGQAERLHEIVATQIIEIAKTGERDQFRLYERTLKALAKGPPSKQFAA